MSSLARRSTFRPGGIAFESEASGEIGERIIAYLNQIGRVEGTVARHFYGGFAIQMKLPPLKREKLADQLTWLANRQVLGMPEDRRHERIEPHNSSTTLTLPAGARFLRDIIDVSRSGVGASRRRGAADRRAGHRRLAAGAGGAPFHRRRRGRVQSAYSERDVRRRHQTVIETPPRTARSAPFA